MKTFFLSLFILVNLISLNVAAQDSSSLSPKISIGDRIVYRVIEDRDEEVILPVTETGEVFIPYFGAIIAAGATIEELTEQVTKALEAELYQKATIIMSLQTGSGQSFSGTVFLTGKINRVGPVQIDPGKDNTVSKIILAAGGFADFASSSEVKVVRRDPVTQEIRTIVVDVAAVIKDGDLNKDMSVLDGDFIIVPKKLINW